jgi:16S rRNA processing protein RimM
MSLVHSGLCDPGRPVCLGRVGKPHGIRGEFRLHGFLDDSSFLKGLKCLVLPPETTPGSPEQQDAPQSFTILHCILLKPGVWRLHLAEIATRTRAEQLCGLNVWIRRSDLPALAPHDSDTVYHTDLVGTPVTGEQGEELGVVVRVCNFGAGDLLVVETPSGQGMVPFHHHHVARVAPGAGIALSETGVACLHLDLS